MSQILTTGFTGMVGSRFSEMYGNKYEIQNLGKKEGVDITKYEDILTAFEANNAPVVIHMAAKTDVDGCEDDKLLQEEGEAWQLNVISTENIVKAAQKTSKRVIYISTDFVFNGTKDSYDEDDEPDPVNFYGFTKYQGELAVTASGLSYAVLRISYPYRAEFPQKKDFVRKIVDIMKAKNKITAVTDHIYTPTFIDDIANGLDAFLQKDTLTKCLNYDFDVFGCKLTFEDGSLQPSAGYLPNPINSFLWIWGIDTWPILKNMLPMVHPKNSGFFAKSKPIGWVTGAFMFMKRSVFEKTGGFDEKYFMYGEEIEWCKRINDAGFKVGYIADFSIVHLQGASQPNRDRAFVNELQGLIYYFKKHYSFWPMRFIIKWGSLARILAFKIAGKPDRAVVYKKIFSTI
jgi:dTDP-4-dehydrorhamnose reductase